MLQTEPLLGSRIVIVDDEHANVLLLSRVLESAGYHNLIGMIDPSQALALCRRIAPDLVLLDLNMPTMDGFDLLTRMKAELEDGEYVPIVVVTGDNSPTTKRKALALGATELLVKPADASEVVLRVRNLLELRDLHRQLKKSNELLEKKVKARTKDLEAARLESLELLARAAEFRDDDTGEHTKRVGDLAADLVDRLKLKEFDPEVVKLAAALHDIGKIGIPDAILSKPGPLTPDEFEAMKAHTVMGAAIIGESRSPVLIMAKMIALTHHEKFDGSGYPNGLKQDSIPVLGRIVAVADVFDALTHDRPYKRAWTSDEATLFIQERSGSQFDPQVVDSFLTLTRNGPM